MVYVDDYKGRYRGMIMSHMMADTEEELDAMADRLGLLRTWKQKHPLRPPHYDLSQSKRAEAIRQGAREVTARELVMRFCQDKHFKQGSARRDTQEAPDG